MLPGNWPARHQHVLKYLTALAHRLPAEISSASSVSPPRLCCALKRFGVLDSKWRRDFNREHTVAAGGRNRSSRTKQCRVGWGGGRGRGSGEEAKVRIRMRGCRVSTL